MEEDEETNCHTLCNSPHLESDFLTDIMQQTENVTSACDRRLIEKGQKYKTEMLERHRNTVYRRMANQMKEISASLEENMGIQLLTVQRDNLDSLKEELNQAFKEYHDTMINEEETQASYQWFDLRDREYTECRMKLSERLYALERKSEKSKPPSSVRSRSSTSSKFSRQFVISKRIEAASRAAKLQIEMDFLEQETEFRKLQIKKEIALANAEEAAASKFLIEENEDVKIETHRAKQTAAEAGNTEEPFRMQKATPVKKGNLPSDPDAPPTKPVVPTKLEPQVKCELSQD
ncbi:hypothetical protein P5673_029624 [Acropora cervicornis]|uniref:Uncharacterized protein n=1 Tax=Acropora cervicornis TaxID=6130 RepID=A0AAD9PVF8_ACRCE|nr:hypothetical protein P5673_029624 [Acropora cervicornis]